MVKVLLCLLLAVIFMVAIKFILAGSHILSRHFDFSIYWNGSFLHSLASYLGKIKIPKAVTGVCVSALCGVSVLVNPTTVQADLAKENTQVLAKDNTVTEISGTSKANEPVVEEKAKEETKTVDKNDEKQTITGTKETKTDTNVKKAETDKVVEEKPKESAWLNIPLCETQSPSKTYMDDVKITARSSPQWKLFNEFTFGEVITDDIGFQYIDGVDPDTNEPMKFYTVALGSYYMDYIGQKFRVTMESGFQFGVITGDQKSDMHTHAGNNYYNANYEGHNPTYCVAGSNDMIEFIIDAEVMKTVYPGRNGLANNGSMNFDFDDEHLFAGRIVKMEVLKDE